jgi:hypothetical protein
MEKRTVYEEIESVARGLERDGLKDWRERLLSSHKGIFNGTELYMSWRWYLEQILQLQVISANTRTEAERVHGIINEELR